MRLGSLLAVVVVAGAAGAPASARGDETHAELAGALGVGAFGARPQSTFDLGVDLARGELAVGLGARLRLVAGEGAREEEWDEPSELVRILRHASYRGERVAVAVGPLAGVTLGHGAVVAGHTTGLHLDHGRSGAHLKADLGPVRAEGVVDDLVAPALVAVRAAWTPRSSLSVGVLALAADVAGVALDAEWHPRAWGALTFDAVLLDGVGSGLHFGGVLAHRGATLALEGRAGSDGYLPGWISPLWELERVEFGLEQGMAGVGQRDAAGAGRFGGLSARAQAAVTGTRLEAALAWEGRPGAPDLFTARLALPAWHDAQAAAWASGFVERGELVGAFAAELRVRLPSRLFVVAELGRLYRAGMDASLAPVVTAGVAVGAVLGE